MSDLDKVQSHDWRMMVLTPMVLGLDGVPIIDHTRPVEQRVGCWACNMGFDEGKAVNCPGQDLFDDG